MLLLQFSISGEVLRKSISILLDERFYCDILKEWLTPSPFHYQAKHNFITKLQLNTEKDTNTPQSTTINFTRVRVKKKLFMI